MDPNPCKELKCDAVIFMARHWHSYKLIILFTNYSGLYGQ